MQQLVLELHVEQKPAPIMFEDENPVQRLRMLAAMKEEPIAKLQLIQNQEY